MQQIEINKVTTFSDLWSVYRLVNKVYNQSGIAQNSSDGMMIHHPAQDVVPSSHIYLAEIDGRPIGTLTFTVDNRFGLMVDEDFGEMIELYRGIYPKVACVWRFAVLNEYQSDLRVMKTLIGAAAYEMRKNDVPISFVTVSLQHAKFYERALQMEEVARGKDSNQLIKAEHADVVLLKSYCEKIPERWYPTIKEKQLA